MKLTRVSVMVSDDAKAILDSFQRSHGMSTKDEALDALLLEFGKKGKKAAKGESKA